MKNLAMYLRVSKEDDLIRDESNSITNQRKILHDRAKLVPEFEGMRIREYCDDGFTGKNMNRPGLQEMLSDVRKGLIGAVLVKDLSRFSRDHLAVGEYLEQIFPFLNVRFIAFGDNYDSKDFVGGIAEIDVGFKEILYDYYSVDLSAKVKSALAVAKKNGKYQCSQTPFGYCKDPDDKHRVLVDEEAACVVRRIFKMALDGLSSLKIAQQLNKEGLEAPNAYRFRKYGEGAGTEKSEWSNAALNIILKNEFYIGTYVYHKFEVEEIGGMAKSVDPSEWKRITGHHEAIISDDMFYGVQEAMASRRKRTIGGKHIMNCHVLSRRVFCGVCGKTMFHCWTKRAKFFCRQGGVSKELRHESNGIWDCDLEPFILEKLSAKAEAVAGEAEAVRERADVLQLKLEKERGELARLKSSYDRIRNLKREAYTDFRLGNMEKEAFVSRKDELDREAERIDVKVRAKEGVILEMENDLGDLSADDGFASGEAVISQLSADVVEQFIDRITVWPGKKIEISWKD